MDALKIGENKMKYYKIETETEEWDENEQDFCHNGTEFQTLESARENYELAIKKYPNAKCIALVKFVGGDFLIEELRDNVHSSS